MSVIKTLNSNPMIGNLQKRPSGEQFSGRGAFATTNKTHRAEAPDGYVAYALGVKEIVVGEGDTYEEALADVKSAIWFHIESFSDSVLQMEPPLLEAFVAEAHVDV